MQKIGFAEAVEHIVQQHPEFDREAYQFLREGLEYTVKTLKTDRKGALQHVDPRELCEGLRQFAVKEFGPMVPIVFEYWGIRDSRDLGQIVFHLIEVGIFGKTDSDKLDDFVGALDFEEAFVKPFLPTPAEPSGNRQTEPGLDTPRPAAS